MLGENDSENIEIYDNNGGDHGRKEYDEVNMMKDYAIKNGIPSESFKCIFKPEPKYLGDSIPVSGNGDATNDKKQEIPTLE